MSTGPGGQVTSVYFLEKAREQGQRVEFVQHIVVIYTRVCVFFLSLSFANIDQRS